jgi:hypothetical protein
MVVCTAIVIVYCIIIIIIVVVVIVAIIIIIQCCCCCCCFFFVWGGGWGGVYRVSYIRDSTASGLPRASALASLLMRIDDKDVPKHELLKLP